ncbi:MAG TPA: alpha/beta-hydrolase family protein [Ornithinibacter sp.]|nr:alpha/beta-hydrolase family protein [Ornithinibacter sp.]
MTAPAGAPAPPHATDEAGASGDVGDVGDSGDAGLPAPEEERRRRRPRRLSLTGGVLGLAFGAMSATPSLVPRGWLIEGLLAGVSIAVGYGLGAFVGWAYRALGLPDLPAGVRRVTWKVLAVLAVVGLLVMGWLGRWWQSGQRELLGMDTAVPWLWLLAPLLGLVVAALLIGLGRAVKALGRLLFRLLRRVLPVRVAWLIAIVATGLLTWTLLSGVLVGNALEVADSVFASNNDEDKPGVVNPELDTRSGGPTSKVSWASIGREGRAFVWSGLTAEEISTVVGDADAVEPVRAFVGLEAAPTPTERAQLAVAELRALGGFDRGAIAVAGGTGSGWIDPRAADALEYATHGDVATVSMQYSYLPSWLSFLVDQSRAATNAEQLITALRVELDGMPADSRPDLYVYGESLGAFSTDSAFTSVEDMSTTTDGALLIGPPSFDTTWQKVVAGRETGSPVWKPLYGDGGLVRVATTADDLTDQTLTWTTDNPIIYLTHASDPIVAWTADHDAWLDPRGPDVSRYVVPWPVVAGLQATFDQFNANGVPAGHGHVYDETTVTAWSEIVGPPSLPDAEVAAIQAAVKDLPH